MKNIIQIVLDYKSVPVEATANSEIHEILCRDYLNDIENESIYIKTDHGNEKISHLVKRQAI